MASTKKYGLSGMVLMGMAGFVLAVLLRGSAYTSTAPTTVSHASFTESDKRELLKGKGPDLLSPDQQKLWRSAVSISTLCVNPHCLGFPLDEMLEYHNDSDFTMMPVVTPVWDMATSKMYLMQVSRRIQNMDGKVVYEPRYELYSLLDNGHLMGFTETKSFARVEQHLIPLASLAENR